MLLPEIKAIVTKVHNPEKISEKYTKRTVTIKVPARTNEWGEKVNDDDFFELDMNVTKYPEDFLHTLIDHRVTVKCFLNSFEYEDKTKKEQRHGLRLSLYEIKKFDKE